jgi:hypothetical protein
MSSQWAIFKVLLLTTALITMALISTNARAGCDGYPLQTRGSGPAGYVCRCVYGGPMNEMGWWAVMPGNPRSQVLSCHGPDRKRRSQDSSTRFQNSSVPTFTHPTSPLPMLPSNSAGYTPRAPTAAHYFPSANKCVYIDRSNSLGDFIGNKCSFQIAVWFCLTDPGHSFQCGRVGSRAGQLDHVGAHDKSSTLKGHNYKWFACGSPGISAYLFSANETWDGQNLRGRCTSL